MMPSTRRARALVLVAIALLFGSACTPEQVTTFAAQNGVELAPGQAEVISKALAAPPLPCRNGVCPSGGQWASLRRCEGGSGNPYLAVNPSGKYRGAYQMDRNFWRAYGGDPAYLSPPRWEQAPPAMQDRVAFAGYRARGSAPWPVCGRFLR